MINKRAGRPPRFDRVLIPSMPENIIMIYAIEPMVVPQVIFMANGAVIFSVEIPLVLNRLIASVFESAAVTYEIKAVSKKTILKTTLMGI